MLCYHSPKPQPTPKNPNMISLPSETLNQSLRPLIAFQFLLFCFSPPTLHFHFHVPISVSTFPFSIYCTFSVLLLSCSSVKYQSLMNLQQVCSTPSSSAIPFLFQSPSYFHHISDTPPFIPVPPCLILRPYVPCFIDICFHVTMIL